MRAKGFRLNKSVYFRLLALTLLAMLIFYAMGVFLNHMGMVNASRGLLDMAQARADYLAGELKRGMDNLMLHEQEVAGDEALLRLAVAPDSLSDYRRTMAIRLLSNELFRVCRMSSMVDAAEIYLPDMGYVIRAEQTIFDDIDPDDEALLAAAAALPTSACLEWRDGLRLLFRRDFGKGAAVVSVGIPYGNMLERMRNMSIPDDAFVALIREDGSIAAQEDGLVLPEGELTGTRIANVGGTEYVFSLADMPNEGLRVLYCRQVDTVLYAFMRHGGWLWVLTVVSLVMVVIYMTYFRKAVYHPLNTIYEAMEQVKRPGEFEITESGNEFKDIYTQYQYMVNRLERLASEVYEERYRATQAELAQLQTQINPHFFYNTLFLIYRMARDEGCDDIAELSGHLSRFYRYITKSPGQTVALRDEVEHISNYLEIQRIRFAPRISIEQQALPEAIADERIPSLIIQPLVENAFVHGVKDAAWKATVSLRYEYGEDWFEVIVADNGGSMTEEKVKEITRRLDENDMHEGSALSNLKRRMALRYGGDYTLTLSCVDDGLTARVRFPRGREDEDHAVAVDRR